MTNYGFKESQDIAVDEDDEIANDHKRKWHRVCPQCQPEGMAPFMITLCGMKIIPRKPQGKWSLSNKDRCSLCTALAWSHIKMHLKEILARKK